jgi:uncharacterized membrane protein YbjE (DUF340 family)
MIVNLIIILLPLVIGYLIRLSNESFQHCLNRLLGGMVYVILFLMGISLSLLDNLASNITMVFFYAGLFFIFTLSANLVALSLINFSLRWKLERQYDSSAPRFKMIAESLGLCGVVAVGFLLGLTQWPPFQHASLASDIVLIVLLFLIGVQLRNSGMNLRQILINRNGLIIALTVTGSALLGGMIAALLAGLPITSGLAVASGFGWYSLSGSLLTKSLGPILGSAAFFNDLARELCAIALIPALIKKNPTVALGISGATSMDFTLPILQRSGGINIVPAAIVQGFILSLLAPVLMAIFSQ